MTETASQVEGGAGPSATRNVEASTPDAAAAAPNSAAGALDLAGVILDLLQQRSAGATICPSDAARAAYTGSGDGWRVLMQPVRDAAAQLADDGLVDVTQGGQVIDVRTARGPVRIRRRQR